VKYIVYSLDDLTKAHGLPFGDAKSTGPGRTGPSAGQDTMSSGTKPFSEVQEHDPRKKPKKRGTIYLPLEMPGSGIQKGLDIKASMVKARKYFAETSIEQVRKDIREMLEKSEGFVKPHASSYKGKPKFVRGHRRKMPFMEAAVWQVAKDHGVSRNQAEILVRNSLTINDEYTGFKHELHPESLIVTVNGPDGTALEKKHATFTEAIQTLGTLRQFAKKIHEEYETAFAGPSGEVTISPPNMDKVRQGYANVIRKKFGFEAKDYSSNSVEKALTKIEKAIHLSGAAYKAGKVPVKVSVTREGKTFLQTMWLRPGQKPPPRATIVSAPDSYHSVPKIKAEDLVRGDYVRWTGGEGYILSPLANGYLISMNREASLSTGTKINFYDVKKVQHKGQGQWLDVEKPATEPATSAQEKTIAPEPHPTTEITAEQKAIALSQNKAELHRRLLDAKTVLTNQYKSGFGAGAFDFENKRLIGDNGLVLQWQTRSHPELPESYDNQQTTVGTVVAKNMPKLEPTTPDVKVHPTKTVDWGFGVGDWVKHGGLSYEIKRISADGVYAVLQRGTGGVTVKMSELEPEDETPPEPPKTKEVSGKDLLRDFNFGKTEKTPQTFYKPTQEQIEEFKNIMYAQDLESLKTSTQQEAWLLKMGNEANRLLFNGQLKNFHFSLLSMRGRRKLGTYFPSLGWVKMNPRYFFSNENKVAIHATFVHELCHKACNEIQKARQFEGAHGNSWAQWMRRVGLPPDRLNKHKLDIDTPSERLRKNAAHKAIVQSNSTPLSVSDFQPKRLVKFFHKNSWIVGQLIRPIGGGVRWGVGASTAVGMWRVPTSLLFVLSPEEQTLHAPKFADDVIYNHIIQLAVPRRRRMFPRSNKDPGWGGRY